MRKGSGAKTSPFTCILVLLFPISSTSISGVVVTAMDFASLMNSQISASKQNNGNGGNTNSQKYLRRSEIEAQRQEAYLREQEELEKARVERLEKKRKRDEEEAERNRVREDKRRRLAEESRRRAEEEKEAEERERRRRLGLPEFSDKAEAGDMEDSIAAEDGNADIEGDELLAKLQELGEPRRLFGEDHSQRLRRYRKLTESKAVVPTTVLSKGPIPTTLELVPEAEMKVPATVPKDEEGRKYLLRQIASYFDMVLSEWRTALSRRPQEVKESFTGKQAYNNFQAAKSNLAPLFRQLESNTLPPTLLTPIHEIVNLSQLKRYVNANDAYLRLSIGKAAWPIGVTMVGIHERSAREKLHESEKDGAAQILADERTRKMLQGIKRCLSFAQTRWPPGDAGQIMG